MLSKKINHIISIIIAINLGLAAGIFSYTQVLQVPDQVITNWYYDHTVVTSLDNRITVVAIDQASTAKYGPYETWSRSLLADAVTELAEQNAAVIGLDLNLSNESKDIAGDIALADACADAGNVVALANAHYTNLNSETDKPDTPAANSSTIHNDLFTSYESQDLIENDISAITYPYDELLSNVNIGIANATQQSIDGIIRNAALTIDYDDTTYDSFAVAVYKTYNEALGQEYSLPQLDSKELFGFNALSGEVNCNIISFSDLLTGNYDTDLVTDGIILIGEYTKNPITRIQQFMDPTQTQQEVCLQASIIQSLLSQKIIKNVAPIIQAVCYTLIIAVFYMIIVSNKIWKSIFACFLLSQVMVGIGFIAHSFGYRFQLLVPLLFLVIALILALIQRYILSIIETKRMERTLKMYVEPQVVDELTDKMPFELKSLSERRQIAVLFVDIRGFTTISESLEPEQVVEILNEYLTLIAKAIQHWGGTLDKFIGDAAMAFFNAPKEQEDYVLRAVCAAEEIIRTADNLREKYETLYGKTINFGIGINCGDAIVGNIGSMSRMDYTAIGDTVNTASRLESNAKAGQILVSEAVWNIVKDHVDGSYIGSLSLKGKTRTVETYQINTVTNPPKLPASYWEEFIHEKNILYPQIGSNK